MLTPDGEVLPTIIALDQQPSSTSVDNDQDFGWLDEILFDPQTYYTLNTNNEFVRTELRTDWVKAAIQNHITVGSNMVSKQHFTAQAERTSKKNLQVLAKQHQVDLLRARIDVLQQLSDVGEIHHTVADYRLDLLQIELAELEDKDA